MENKTLIDELREIERKIYLNRFQYKCDPKIKIKAPESHLELGFEN